MSATPETSADSPTTPPSGASSGTTASDGQFDASVGDVFDFAMGEFTARFPRDRLYAKNHMWALPPERSDRWRFGLSAYAVRLLQDVYFLDWLVEPGMTLTARQQIGSIESKKAESDLYSPASGVVASINQEVLDDPSAINAAPYEAGWLFELVLAGHEFLDGPGYQKHLEDAWVVAQRTIKGQANFSED